VGARHSHSLKSLAEVKAGGSARHQPLEQEFIGRFCLFVLDRYGMFTYKLLYWYKVWMVL